MGSFTAALEEVRASRPASPGTSDSPPSFEAALQEVRSKASGAIDTKGSTVSPIAPPGVPIPQPKMEEVWTPQTPMVRLSKPSYTSHQWRSADDLNRGPVTPDERNAENALKPTSDGERFLKGMLAGGVEQAEGLTSLENVGILAAMALGGKIPNVGPALSAGASGAFSVQMMRDAFAAAPQAMDAWKRGDYEEAGRLLSMTLGGSTMAALGLRHAGKGVRRATDVMTSERAGVMPKAQAEVTPKFIAGNPQTREDKVAGGRASLSDEDLYARFGNAPSARVRAELADVISVRKGMGQWGPEGASLERKARAQAASQAEPRLSREQPIQEAAPAAPEWELKPRENLADAQREVESRTNEAVRRDPESYLRRYEEEHGSSRIYNADKAAELFDDYRTDRTSNREAVSRASSKIAYEAFQRRLATEPAEASPTVVLTAGGTGSGKSTGVREMADAGAIVYDSTLADTAGAHRLVDSVLNSGRDVVVKYTFRDPVEAFRSTVDRASGEGGGRVVDIATHASTHEKAPQAVKSLYERYQGDPRVQFTFEEIGAERGLARGGVELLDKGAYTGSREVLRGKLDEWFQQGSVPERVYRALAPQADRGGRVPDVGLGTQTPFREPGGVLPQVSRYGLPPQQAQQVTESRSRLTEFFKDESGTFRPDVLRDLATVGVEHFKRGVEKFTDWSREMVREFGERVKPHLLKVWVEAKRLWQSEAGTGTSPVEKAAAANMAEATETQGVKQPAKKTAVAAEEKEPLAASPNYLQSKDRITKNLDVSPEVKAEVQAALDEYATTAKPTLKTYSFKDVMDEARSLGGNEMVLALDKSKYDKWSTVPAPVKLKMREMVNGLGDHILKLEKEQKRVKSEVRAEGDTMLAELEKQIDQARKDQQQLLDVLMPMRSQDGRNLAYWRIQAEQSFDTEFWMSRARRAAGLKPEATELPKDLADSIKRITAEGQAAEQAAQQQAKARARRVQRLTGEATEAAPVDIGNDPKVKAKRLELAKTLAKAERTTKLQTALAIWKAGLLTGLKTHLRNILGNASFQVMEEVHRVPAAMVDIAISTMTGQRTVHGLSVRDFVGSVGEAATKGVREAKEILKTGTTAEQTAHLELTKELNSGNAEVDMAVNSVFRALKAQDAVFKRYAYERALREQMRLAKVTTPTVTMQAEAMAYADFATFNNPNQVASAFQRFKSGLSPTSRAVTEFVIPFVNTPTNVFARMVDYSPAGFLKGAVEAAKLRKSEGKFTAKQQAVISHAIGRGLVGSALILAGYYAREKGWATGVKAGKESMSGVEEAAGQQPGSIKINGKWQQVSALAPGGNLFVLGASMAEEAEVRKTKPSPGETAGRMAGLATRTVLDQPMVSGVSSTLDALKDPNRSLGTLARQSASSLIPAVVGTAAQIADPTRRETRESIVDSMQSKIPGAASKLPERTDVLGRPLDASRANAVNPFQPAEDRSDAATRELQKLQVPVTPAKPRPSEDKRMVKERGEIVGKLIHRQLLRAIGSPAYQRADEERKQRILLDSIQTARDAVTNRLKARGYDKADKDRQRAILSEVAKQFELR